MATAIVVVEGGIAEVWHQPEDVEVHIVDLDDIVNNSTYTDADRQSALEIIERMRGLQTALMEETTDSTAITWERKINRLVTEYGLTDEETEHGDI